MKTILIIGAGRSATSLILYLLERASDYNWHVIVADMSLELAQSKIGAHPRGKAVAFSVLDAEHRRSLIASADIVVSMLPATLHIHVAKDCVELGKNLCTASYVADDLRLLQAEIERKGLTFLCELGLDPGIDHMSAMQLIHHLRKQHADIQSFRSYTGGLVAPEHDDNPWHYKFTWNPRNVVVAGQNTAKYLQDGTYKFVPYQRLFAEAEPVEIPSLGTYEIYPNRNSLQYCSLYELDNIPTLVRATIRGAGFSKAWNILVHLGLTDDSYSLENEATMTYRQYLESFLPPHIFTNKQATIREKIAHLCNLDTNDAALDKIEWLDLWNDDAVGLANATPAQILQKRLEQKWVLKEKERDLIIMQHEFIYTLNNKKYLHLSTLIQRGEDAIDTAMSSLVGIPLAIGAKHVLLGTIKTKGIHIPTTVDIYEPIMTELAEYGVRFVETIQEI